MVRDNGDGTRTPLTMPNHPTLKGSTLRAILTQSNISREEFLAAYEKALALQWSVYFPTLAPSISIPEDASPPFKRPI
jgi:hypothetical protein